MELDVGGKPTLDEEIRVDTVTVQFKPSVIEDEVDTPTGLPAEPLDALPELWQVVSENVLFGSGEMFAAGRLKSLELLFSHVDEEGKIGRVTPEADYAFLRDNVWK